ncbi:MAG: amidoligase family protein [Streptomycetaceae bacterium]|nr:amidoligase family protein [Streptomycetaceae bacterium]
MGSGSRIDHQHHLVATSAAGITIEAPAGGVDLMPAEQRQILERALQIQSGWRTNPHPPLEEIMEYWGLRGQLRNQYGMWNGHGLIQDSEPGDDSAEDDRTAAVLPDQRAPDVTVQRAASQQVLDEVSAEHRAATALQEQVREQWPTDEAVSYTDDFDAFQRDYDAARERAERGEQVIPYMTENATGGLGARDGGRGFGVEIEFDIEPGVDRQQAIQNIARELRDAGLSRTARQYDYHAQMSAGYTDEPNAWRLESDCTVAGELVSPILYDEPQTWNNLARACEIIQRNGGRASFSTGGHVHVGMHDFDHDVANHTRLMQMYKAHEDVLYRLAQNPASEGRHRGTSWCSPNPVPSQGYTAISQINSFHGQALNLSGARRGGQSAHGEFRLWDGSLNPRVIQTQVKLSLGMAAAAVRQDTTTPSARMELGSHREQRRQAGLGQRRRLSGDDWRTSTANFRQMVDSLFQRPEDKAQATALFHETRWQRR